MFGLLNTTQIYGIQHQHQEHATHLQITNTLTTPTTNSLTSNYSHKHNHRRSQSSVSDSGHRFFAKNPTHFIEKFLKTDFLATYDTIKNYRHYPANSQSNSNSSSNTKQNNADRSNFNSGNKLSSFNCLHGHYRHSTDGEFYDRVEVKNTNNNNISKIAVHQDLPKTTEMTIKCSKNLLAVEPVEQEPATLQNYQKIPESEHDLLVDALVASSGASSGEFNSSSDATNTTTSSNSISSSLSSSNLYKRLSFGGRNSQATKQEKNADNIIALAQQHRDGVSE